MGFLFKLFKTTPVPQPEPAPSPSIPPPQISSDFPELDFLLARVGYAEGGKGEQEVISWWKFSTVCKNYKSITGATYAWCGITQAAAENAAGRKIPNMAESASDWVGYGNKVDWQKNGIPKNAIVVIQHRISGGFHVTRSTRDHYPGEAYFEGCGGNQNNALNITKYYHSAESVQWVGLPEGTAVKLPEGSKPIEGRPLLSWEKLQRSWDVRPPTNPTERKAWSDKLFEMVGRDDIFPLFDSAADITTIRPDFKSLTNAQKIAVIAEFFCQLSIYECDWKPDEIGDGVSPDDDALGLFQMGFRDQKGWSTGTSYSREQLLDGKTNCEVAVLIMKTQLQKTGRILIKKVKGAGADGVFWAPIYVGGKYDSSEKIVAAVRGFKVQ